MVMPGISAHARVRMQQRGISESVLERLIEFGEIRHDHRGAEILFFDKAARRRLAARLDARALKAMERQMKAYAVLAGNGDVITVGHRMKRIPNT
jgi:hypothetical protein